MKLVREMVGAPLQDKLAACVLICEALYFLTATVIVTGLGIAFAQDSGSAYGLLGTGSLPLLVVGALALWSLALLHVLPPRACAKSVAPPKDGLTVEVYDLPARGRARGNRDGAAPRGITRLGFYAVTVAHLAYAGVLAFHGQTLFALAMCVLGLLLLACSVSTSWKRPAPRVAKDALGDLRSEYRVS